MWRSNLAVILEQRGISQRELCRRAGLSYQTTLNAYHGRPVSPMTMIKIALTLDVPLAVLDPVAADDLAGLVIRPPSSESGAGTPAVGAPAPPGDTAGAPEVAGPTSIHVGLALRALAEPGGQGHGQHHIVMRA